MVIIMANAEFYMQKVNTLIASIMQPSFLPWLGYFNLIRKSDIFVFLDNVQFEPRSWQHRNRIYDGKREIWLSVSTTRPSGRESLISEVLVNYEHFRPEQLQETLRRVYMKHPFYSELESIVSNVFSKNHSLLCNLNVDLIKSVSNSLGLSTIFVMASSLKVRGRKAELLDSILGQVKADVLLSPVGSKNYLEPFGGHFPSGVEIRYQEFSPFPYRQRSSTNSLFVDSLSFVDALANVGLSGLKELI